MGGAATPAHGHRLPVSCSSRGSDLSPSFASFSFNVVYIQSNFHLVIIKNTVQKKIMNAVFVCFYAIFALIGLVVFITLIVICTLSLKYGKWGADPSHFIAKQLSCCQSFLPQSEEVPACSRLRVPSDTHVVKLQYCGTDCFRLGDSMFHQTFI